jgi:prepilin-type N-terminal cleavage/methylation domain-containing protein
MPRNQKGFTLMELMVVIVIVAILAAVAVPLYINYVNDAQRTEAKGAIGAIITGEAAYLQKNGGTTYADLAGLEADKFLDITEAKTNWDFTATPNGGTGFVITAKGKGGTNKPSTSLGVTYTFTRTGGGLWTDSVGP